MKLIDRAGDRYGRLVVIKRGENKSGKPAWVCQCDCGNTKTIAATSLTRGIAKSCGCLRKEVAAGKQYRHGMKGTKTYYAWLSMRKRCLNPRHEWYHRYGGRGITICEQWSDFTVFLNDMGVAPEGMSLERIDNNKGYSPDNCKWATQTEQTNNRAGNRHVLLNGIRMTLSQCAREINESYNRLLYRHTNNKPFTDIHSNLEAA